MYNQGGGWTLFFGAPIFCCLFIIGVLCAPFIEISMTTFVWCISVLCVAIGAKIPLLWLGAFVFGLLRVKVGIAWHTPVFLSDARWYGETQIASVFSGSERSLISGLLFGGAESFSSYWKGIFVTTGTMHVVAVSGANVAFHIQWFDWILRRLYIMPKVRWFASILFLIMFVGITGGSPSVVRAAIMAGLAMGIPLLHRTAHGFHVLAYAAGLMVFFQPHVASDIGFQLSIMATLGLILFSSSNSLVHGIILETVAATVCVLPLESYYFGRISIIALLANVLIAPLITPLVVLGLFAGVGASFIPNSFSWFFELPPKLFLKILETCAHIPGSAGFARLSLGGVILWYVMVAVAAIFRFRKSIRPG